MTELFYYDQSYKDYCCGDQKHERIESFDISRQPYDSDPGSYTGRTPKDRTSNLNPEYKIYKQEDTPPSKNNAIQHDWNDQKNLGGMGSRTNSTTLYTSEKSNMDYVTLPGVCKRTGCSVDELVIWIIRQLVDNGVDSVESNYNEDLYASNNTRIYISTKYEPNANQLVINVSNPNFGRHGIGFTQERVNSIYRDLNQFVSSKRNLFKLTRGYQGDAMQEVLGIPTALASKYNKGKTEWNEPLIIRNGAGQEFEIRIIVDKVNGHNFARIKTNHTNVSDNLTQVEIRVPYNEDIIDLDKIKQVLIEYTLLNTHQFQFRFSGLH